MSYILLLEMELSERGVVSTINDLDQALNFCITLFNNVADKCVPYIKLRVKKNDVIFGLLMNCLRNYRKEM
jgi:hypothetical protein